MNGQAHGGQTQKVVGTPRPAQLPELQYRNEMDTLNANRRDDHRACFCLRRLLLYLKDQIHGQGDQYFTQKLSAPRPRNAQHRPAEYAGWAGVAYALVSEIPQR